MKIKIDVAGIDLHFISDFHLFHKNVIKFDKRPFVDANGNPDIPAMHATILNNWNDAVDEKDVVFYLGDLSFGRPDLTKQFVDQLNGKIHFIMGNHDKYKDIAALNRFETINDYVDLNILNGKINNNLHFAVMHYPIFSWNRASHGSFMIHGHTHGNLHHGEPTDYHVGRKAIDVGCNLIEYTPISYIKIIEKLNHIENERTKETNRA